MSKGPLYFRWVGEWGPVEDGFVYGVCADVAPLTGIEEAGPDFSALKMDEDSGIIVWQIFICRSPLDGGVLYPA